MSISINGRYYHKEISVMYFFLLNYYYHLIPYTGQAEPSVFEGTLPHIPLYFTDKQTYSAAIDNVYVGGVAGIPYTDCEVFMPLGLHTNVRVIQISMPYILNM